MESASNLESDAADSQSRILNLPPELRNSIWAAVVAMDLQLIHKENVNSLRRTLTILKLLHVNKQVNDEATAVFRERSILNFISSDRAIRLLGYRFGVSTYNTHTPRVFPRPRIILKIAHLSVLPPKRTATTSGMHGLVGRRSVLYYNLTNVNEWVSSMPRMAELLRGIRWCKVELRTLEIPASLLFNASIVRLLRRLRGITLHLAFIPETEATAFEKLSLEEANEGVNEEVKEEDPHLAQELKWLGESADISLVLPIYESSRAVVPTALAPFSRFAAALRREVASTEAHSISVSQAQKDQPLWIDFDVDRNINPTTAPNGLSAPLSGWYLYVAHEPGICCLQQTSGPTPALPLRRKNLRRCRHEEWKLRVAQGDGCSCHVCTGKRIWKLQHARRDVLRQMGIDGVVIKAKASGSSMPPFHRCSRTFRRM